MDKKQLRKLFSDKRDAYDRNKKGISDKQVFEYIKNSNLYKSSKVIFIYVSFGSEVDTHLFIKEALEEGKVIAVPYVISLKEGMCAIAIRSLSELKPGKYGILEPVNIQEIIPPEELDLVLLPGLAFDLSGGRLGYGGGFYDRFLRKLKPSALKVALAYSMQICDSVPTEPWDEAIDGILTEKGFISFKEI